MAIKSVFFLVFLLTVMSAQAATFVPERVAPDVYAFIGDTGPRTYENEGMNANAGFIVTPAGVVVVDSGSGWQVARAMHEANGGHTPGDAVVWLPRWRVLFSGDLAYTDRLLGVAAVSNTRNWLASFDELERLNPEWIVPGHGKVSRLDQAQRETRDYLVLLRSHMKKALDAGLDLQTAIDSLDQSPFSYLANYEQLKGVNASRVYLELESE